MRHIVTYTPTQPAVCLRMESQISSPDLREGPQQTAKSYTYRMLTLLWYALIVRQLASTHTHTQIHIHSTSILLQLSSTQYTSHRVYCGHALTIRVPHYSQSLQFIWACNQQPTLACTVSVPLHHFQPYVCELLRDPFTCEFAGYFAVNLFTLDEFKFQIECWN